MFAEQDRVICFQEAKHSVKWSYCSSIASKRRKEQNLLCAKGTDRERHTHIALCGADLIASRRAPFTSDIL